MCGSISWNSTISRVAMRSIRAFSCGNVAERWETIKAEGVSFVYQGFEVSSGGGWFDSAG
jgi:hypothetical protein